MSIKWGFSFRGDAKSKTLELDIYDDIGESFWGESVSAKSVRQRLKEHREATLIKVRINSRGGDVLDGSAIYTLLKEHPARVEIDVDGVAASMASVIAMAGDEIRISPAAYIMIHNPWGVAIGEAEEMRLTADLLDKMRGTLADIYTERTKQKRADVLAWMEAETWLTAKEAVEKGFADSVSDGARGANKKAKALAFRAFAADLGSYRNVPGELVAELLASAPDDPPAALPQPSEQPPQPGPKETGPAGKDGKSMKTIALILGLSETATEEQIAAALKERLAAPTETTVAVSGVKLLGVATEAEATNKIKELQNAALQVTGATGKTTVAEAMGVVLEWKTKADQTDSLTKQVATITEESRIAKRDAAIEKLSREGSLPPARHEWAKSQFATAEQVETFCAGMPKGFFSAAVTEVSDPMANIQLSESERKICAQLGLTEAAYLEEKKAQAKARSERVQAGV